MTTSAAVAVISKIPRAGGTKTRLAAGVGAEAALALHTAFLQDELAELDRPERWRLHLVHDAPTSTDEAERLHGLLDDRAQSVVPGCDSLGHELAAAASMLLENHDRVVIVSGDVPQLPARTVIRALDALDNSDVVLGPGVDGGYYLVGLKVPHDIFTRVEMSTNTVLGATIALAHNMGLAVKRVDSLRDMDEAQDLLDLAHAPRSLASRTREVIAGLSRTPVSSELPVDLQVEVTNRCNLQCEPCLRSHVPLGPDKDMTLAEFRRIVDGLPRLARITFQLNGEPLLCPDLFSMIALAKRRGAYTALNTNGTLLHGARRWKLLESGIDEVRVSLHGAFAVTHDRLAGATVFDKVVANLRGLTSGRRDGHPVITVWQIGTQDTIEELPQLVRLAADAGADGVYLQRLVLTGTGNAVDSASLFGRADRRVCRAIEQAERVAHDRGISLAASGRQGPLDSLRKSELDNPWLGCWRPWRSVVVTATMDVLPCCIASFRAPYAQLKAGNLMDQSWETIWNTTSMQTLRSGLLKGDPVPWCAGCTQQWCL